METMTVARYLEQQIALCGKSQKAIAAACGYQNPNIITMFKKGRTKLPFQKVPSMARALNADPRHLLRLTMLEYLPEIWEVIEHVMGEEVSITLDEVELLKFIRALGYKRTPRLDAIDTRVELTVTIARAVARDDGRDSAAVARLDSLPRNARSK
jgi:transcriptional regulator with XRE-family HTH domain